MAPKKGKRSETTVDGKQAPTRPVGGAYGIFVSERRADFIKEAAAAGPAGAGAVAKLASAKWRVLPGDERATFEEKYRVVQAKYKEEIAAFREAAAKASPADTATECAKGGTVTSPPKRRMREKAPAQGPAASFGPVGCAEVVSPPPKRRRQPAAASAQADPLATPVKRGRPPVAKEAQPLAVAAVPATAPAQADPLATPVKRGRPPAAREAQPLAVAAVSTPSKKCPGAGASPAPVEFSEEVLASAGRAGLRVALANLAARAEVAELGMPAERLLAELKKAGGLVNRAKASLLSA